jgi:hypothetical protein
MRQDNPKVRMSGTESKAATLQRDPQRSCRESVESVVGACVGTNAAAAHTNKSRTGINAMPMQVKVKNQRVYKGQRESKKKKRRTGWLLVVLFLDLI